MVQEIRTKPNIFGYLGKGLAQGLEETVPKEIEHQRLRSGLQDLANESDKGNLSPAQFLARAAGTYGSTPQITQSFGELAKFQGERNAAINAGGGGYPTQSSANIQGAPASNQNIPPQRATRENPVSEVNLRIPQEKRGISTYSPVNAALSDIREPTQQELFQKRSQILKQNPYMSVPAAEQQAQDFFRRQNAQKVADIEKGGREEAVESKISGKQQELKNSLGTLAKDVPDDVFDRSLQRQQYAVANEGKTPTKAVNDEKKDLAEFSKAYNSLKNNIGTRPFFDIASPELRKSIKNLKPAFEKVNELPLFKNTIVNNLDIGDHLASLETWNPGKEVENAIVNTSVNDPPEKIAAKLGKAIKGKDDESLFALGYLLHKIGVDDMAVIDEMMNLSRNGVINLNQRQMQEGAEYYPVQPKLEDDFFISMGGLFAGPLLRQLTNYITGQRQKVGPIEKIKRKFGGKE